MSEEAIKRAYIKGYFAGMDERYINNTAYTNGFRAGQRNEREYFLSFIKDHETHPLTVDDIEDEIEGRYRVEMNEYLKGLK
jgi:hypothetical protein